MGLKCSQKIAMHSRSSNVPSGFVGSKHLHLESRPTAQCMATNFFVVLPTFMLRAEIIDLSRGCTTLLWMVNVHTFHETLARHIVQQ